MKNISAETKVGELVRAVPSRARVFENLGIDYCCGGKKPLGKVCRAKNLDPATVVAMPRPLPRCATCWLGSNPNTSTLGRLETNMHQHVHK